MKRRWKENNAALRRKRRERMLLRAYNHPSMCNHIAVHAALEPGKISFTLSGRTWGLFRPADLESLWGAITDEAFTADERLPYWVELWPASLALAVWLESNRERINNRICLDLGCGLGFTSLVGTLAGARVIAVDYEPAALAYASKNAAHNAAPSPLWAIMDWRKPAVAPKSCAYIWGGDIMYENRFVAPVFDFIAYALAENGVAWIAEPGRGAYELFRTALISNGWSSRCIAANTVDALHVQPSPVSVKLWELSRG
jgi:predicted nicotinamide N-methyase